LALGAFVFAAVPPAKAGWVRRDGFQSQDGYGIGFVQSGIGFGRAAFPIPGAIPAGTPYDPYRLPYSYSWPYGYGYSGR